MAENDWLIDAARAGLKPSPYDEQKISKTDEETAEFYQKQTSVVVPVQTMKSISDLYAQYGRAMAIKANNYGIADNLD